MATQERKRSKYDGAKHCPYCFNPRFNTGSKIGGHLRHCYARPIDTPDIITMEDLRDEEFVLDTCEDAFRDTFAYLSQEFISSQKDYLSDECLRNLSAGRVKLLNGTYGTGNVRIYLLICQFVSACSAAKW